MMLEVSDLHAYYGKSHILQGVHLTVGAGEIVSILGRNGVGRSTTLKAIMGDVPPHGAIAFKGEPIAGLKPYEIAHRGVGYVPEGRRIFPRLTVMENLEMGAYARPRNAELQREYDHVFHLFPVLGKRRTQLGGTLSGGEQQMLAMGRALMAQPNVLLLDEPSMGLAPKLVEEIFELIGKLKAAQRTILLVEQNARLALEVSDDAYVLETGRIRLSGKAHEIATDQRVLAAYLGG